MRILFILIVVLVAIIACMLLSRTSAPGTEPPHSVSDGTKRVWYIDATAGDDQNSGRSAEEPWKTLGRLGQAPLLPGDSILLHRGGIWRESLTITSAGEHSAPITVGAYGEGSAPSIRGSDSYSSPGQWRYDGEGLWYIDDLRSDPGMVIRDGQPARRRTGKDDLAEPWDFFYDGMARRLYVRIDTNPAAVADCIEVPVRDFVVGPLSTNYLRLIDLDFRHPRKTTMLLWEADHVSVEDCVFLQSAGTHLQIGQGSNFARMEGCSFDQWAAAESGGYAIQAVEAGSGPSDIEACTFNATLRGTGSGHTAVHSEDKAWIRAVRACQFLGNRGNLSGDGVYISRPSGAASTITIEQNFFQALGGSAIVLDGLDHYGGNLEVLVQRNKIEEGCQGDYLDSDGIRAQGLSSGKTSLLIAGNLIQGTVPGNNRHEGLGLREARGARIIHNAISGADDGVKVGFGAVETLVVNTIITGNRGAGIRDESGGATCSHNVYYNNAGGDAVGFILGPDDSTTNPLLDDTLRPGNGSPCIDRGIDAGLVLDLDGKRVPSGAGPDIGPYEFIPSRP